MSNVLAIERQGQVVSATLTRPDVGNSLSSELVAQLQQLVDQCREDDTALLVLRADGKHFCTGFDLSDLESETDDTLLARFVRIELLLQAIHAAPFPTAAVAKGRIMGAGADLFVACEVRWLTDKASFSFPGAAFGLVLGTGRLARLVGKEKARDWVSSGRRVESDEALACGLVTAQMGSDSVAQEIERLAARAQRLDSMTRKRVYAVSGDDAMLRAQDMHALVQSAARPGIKARIESYRSGRLPSAS